MIDYGTLSIILTGIGIIVAITYYTLTLRNANRTRQAQLYMDLFQEISSPQWLLNNATLLNQEWEDYDDFEKKYGSNEHPEHYAMRRSMWLQLGSIGVMLKMKLLDPEMVYFLLQERASWQWKKWESIIKEQRIRYKLPSDGIWFEYLVNEMERISKSKGIEMEIPNNLMKYIPDE